MFYILKQQIKISQLNHPYPKNSPPICIQFPPLPDYYVFLFHSLSVSLFLCSPLLSCCLPSYLFYHTCPAPLLCNSFPLLLLFTPNFSDCPKYPYISASFFLHLRSLSALQITFLLFQLHSHSMAPQTAMLPSCSVFLCSSSQHLSSVSLPRPRCSEGLTSNSFILSPHSL